MDVAVDVDVGWGGRSGNAHFRLLLRAGAAREADFAGFRRANRAATVAALGMPLWGLPLWGFPYSDSFEDDKERIE